MTNTTTAATPERSRVLPCFELIAGLLDARLTCKARGNDEWYSRHSERLALIERELLPSGSGIDSGTQIDLERSTREKIVLHTSFHHMDEGGYYDGWTEHTITVRASLIGRIQLTISGRDRNGIKEYLYQVFESDLTTDVRETADSVQFVREGA